MYLSFLTKICAEGAPISSYELSDKTDDCSIILFFLRLCKTETVPCHVRVSNFVLYFLASHKSVTRYQPEFFFWNKKNI